MKKLIKVVGAIIENDNKEILCALRSPEMNLPNMWEFPGGKIEIGENNKEALIREIKEELSITISVDTFVKTVEYDYPNFHLTMHCFICTQINGTLTLNEHNDAKWIHKSELDELDWLPADLELLQELKKYL